MEEYNLHDIAALYPYYIKSILAENERNNLLFDQSLFSMYNDSSIPWSEFFKRLFLRMSCCLECYFISLIYIHRLNKSIPGIVNITSYKNIVVTSIELAQKFFDEICYKSEFYASFSNLQVSQINSLEVDYLCRIHFSLCVYPQEFEVFYNQIRNLCNQNEMKSKGIMLPEITNIRSDESCPLLKYVMSSYERKRHSAYTQQRQQERQALMHSSMYPIPIPIKMVPAVPVFPLPQVFPVNALTNSGERFYPPPSIQPFLNVSSTNPSMATYMYAIPAQPQGKPLYQQSVPGVLVASPGIGSQGYYGISPKVLFSQVPQNSQQAYYASNPNKQGIYFRPSTNHSEY